MERRFHSVEMNGSGCKGIVVVEGGKVIQDGPRDAVLQSLQRPRAAA